MKRRGRLRSGWARLALASSSLGLGVLVASSLAACSSASTTGTCDCATSQVTIDVPPDIASSVTLANVQVSGPACTNVTVVCANETNGCTAYDFTPNAAGECDITIDKPSGVFTASLALVEQSGCCAGSFTAAAASMTVDVPEPEDGG